MSFTLAIIGRPNVGKSMLFNRLTRQNTAIVHDQAGVTRDRREADASLRDLKFKIVDTAGLEEAENETIKGKMFEQTKFAIEEADIILMVIDGKEGITPLDEYFAKMVRKASKPIILAVNKCDTKIAKENAIEAYSLGLGEPIELSAAHGLGMGDLYKKLLSHKPEFKIPKVEDDEDDTIKIAIVGRPNAGKSTFINALLGKNRVITGKEAGITRDSIEIPWEYNGQEIILVDTAGIRKKARVEMDMEKLSVADAIKALNYAHVVVLMVDGTCSLEKQDLIIASRIAEEGRVPIIVINKWDLVKGKDALLQDVKDRLEKSFAQIKGVKILTISAEHGKGLNNVIDSALDKYKEWNKRVPTSKLNDWLQYMVEKHPPPLVSGKRLKLRYITQVKARPPSFVISVNKPENLPDSYINYLINGIRSDFNIWGVPIRVWTRKKANPYV